MKVFIDMDGVLADFNLAAHLAHGREDCYPGNPSAYGEWHIEKVWGCTPEEFWAPLQYKGFWENIPKTPEADMIVELCLEKFGEKNTAILTSPSLDPYSVPGKREWIATRYPALKDQMLFGKAKGFVAGPRKVLIDDCDRNIWEWSDEGGYVIQVPRLWNVEWPMAFNGRTYEVVKGRINSIDV